MQVFHPQFYTRSVQYQIKSIDLIHFKLQDHQSFKIYSFSLFSYFQHLIGRVITYSYSDMSIVQQYEILSGSIISTRRQISSYICRYVELLICSSIDFKSIPEQIISHIKIKRQLILIIFTIFEFQTMSVVRQNITVHKLAIYFLINEKSLVTYLDLFSITQSQKISIDLFINHFDHFQILLPVMLANSMLATLS